MGTSKPNPEVRKPPSDDEADDDKVAAFIDGAETSSNSDDQTSGNPGAETSGQQRQQTTVYLDADVKRKLKAYCELEGREMSRVVNELVVGRLEDWEPEW